MTQLYKNMYPEDFLLPPLAGWVVPQLPKLALILKNNCTPGYSTVGKFTGYELLRIMKVDFAMTRRKNGTRADSDGNGDKARISGGGKFHWCNVPLEADDLAFLSEATDNLELLAGAVVGLVDGGLGFSCKPASGGKSVSATLLRTFGDITPDTVGVCAFGGTVRDALLALLYKYDNLLGGEIPSPDRLPESSQSRFG